MAKADDYGLREFIGKETLTHSEQREFFNRTQKAMADWNAHRGSVGGSLGDYYAWLGVATAEPEPKMAIEDSQR